MGKKDATTFNNGLDKLDCKPVLLLIEMRALVFDFRFVDYLLL